MVPSELRPDDSTLDLVIGPANGTSEDLPRKGFQIHGTSYGRVYSALSFPEPNRLELVMDLTLQSWNCTAGDLGSYTFSLSPDSRILTLTTVADACAPRAAILGGGWARTDVADVSPGRHIASIFRPFGEGTGPQFSYTVPDGWAEHYETPDIFSVAHGESWISVYRGVALYARSASCTFPRADIEQTPAASVDWLTTIPGLVMTRQIPLAIGGLGGLMVDVSVAPDWTDACSADGYINTFAVPGLSVGPNTPARYILLDGGDGRTLLIDVQAPATVSWDAAMAAAMPIIESFEFSR